MPTSPSDWQALQQGVQSMRRVGQQQQMRGLLGQATQMMGQPGGMDFQGMMGLAQQAPDPSALIAQMGNMFQMKSQMEQRQVFEKAGPILAKIQADGKVTPQEIAAATQYLGITGDQLKAIAGTYGQLTSMGQPAIPTKTREIKLGGQIVTQELTPQGWRTIANSPRWNPDRDEQIVYGADGQPIFRQGPATGRSQDVGRVPESMRNVRDEAGNIIRQEPIPGGVEDIKRKKQAEEMARLKTEGIDDLKYNFSNAKAKQNRLSAQLQDALNNANAFTTGLLGGGLSLVKGTDSYDLKNTVDTINANLAFDRLQEMRNASKTGGALGQVSERELALLERAIASLNNSQSAEQFRKNVQAVQRHYNNWYDNYVKISQAKAERYGMNPDFFQTIDKGNKGTGLPNVTTQSEFDALPSGAVYLENGQQYKKP